MNVLIKVVPQLHSQCQIWRPPPTSWPGLRTVQLRSCPAPGLPWSQVGAGPQPNQRAATPSQPSPPPSFLPSVTQMRNHSKPSMSPRPPTGKLGVHSPLGCVCLKFMRGSAGKESACNAGDLGLISGLGRSPGEGNGFHQNHSGRLVLLPPNLTISSPVVSCFTGCLGLFLP